MEFYTFDRSYLDRLRAGDPQTEQHFSAYFGQMLGIMLRARRLPPEILDDVRQETFRRVITILRRDDGVKQPERFGAFVNSVCKNVLHESQRESYRSQPLEQGYLEPPDKIVDLERSLITLETKARVREILEQMNSADRELLQAVFLEEGDKDEICRKFRVDRNYLRVRVHRAKERFRLVYEQQIGGAGLPRNAKGNQ